ncbi:hypothetical protein BUALT_Bualt13G0115900 [Buddleja alternifolia]|uniref:Uncharacterized protein n=1 Tax=Buddleja alternifolia TaxID=168488 RepID=A0AAV6WV33_9LAMI|nr:hypothetical protein BUALT_Bualt13G0115900 [Buddleja alternifolia]
MTAEKSAMRRWRIKAKSSSGAAVNGGGRMIKELTLGLELTRSMERVEGKGVISSGWVQQQQILAHASVGCYLCHAGFSSVIEAIVNDLRAGVEVNRRDEDGYFGKEDIKRAIEGVMFEVDKEPGKSVLPHLPLSPSATLHRHHPQSPAPPPPLTKWPP